MKYELECLMITIYFLSIMVCFGMSSSWIGGPEEKTVILKLDAANAPEPVIVTGVKTTETEQFAADELQKFLAKITGKKFPIVKDDTDIKNKFYFSVGSTKYSKGYLDRFKKILKVKRNDCFIIDADAKRVILFGGGDRGTLYSVYEFLEQQGCRWFFPGKLGEYIPESQQLVAIPGLKEYVPDFVQREINIGFSKEACFTPEELVNWHARNRLNCAFNMRTYFVRKFFPKEKQNILNQRGGMQKWQWIAHNFGWMIPNKKYFKDHPEYYSLYNGERTPLSDKHKAGGNLCTTNPDVIRICADFAIDWFDKNPDGIVVPMWPADGAVKWCECENCKKLGGINFATGEKGSMSKRMVVFCNAVAKLVAEKYPDKYILCPVYANYIRPVDIPLEKNILLQFCYHGDYAHKINVGNVNKQEKEWLDEWANLAAGRMGVWEYFLIGDIFDHKENPVYLPVTYRAVGTIKYLKNKGVNWYFTQANPSRHWKHNMLPYYMTARLIWDADQDFDTLLKDYCQKMYGPAGEDVETFFRTIEDQVSESDWHAKMYSDIEIVSPKVYTPEVMKECEECLNRALAAKLTPIQKERLLLLKETFDYLKTNVGKQAAMGIDPGKKWRLERNEDHYLINADGNEISDKALKKIIHNAKDKGEYTEKFKKTLFRARKRKSPIVFLENQVIKVGILPEIGGRIIRLIDKRNDWNYMRENFRKDTLDSIDTKYFQYGGYEEYVGKNFMDPGWEEVFSYKIADDDKTKKLILQAEIRGFNLTRTISVDKGDSTKVKISSILKNISKTDKKIKLRVHPIVTLGKNAGSQQVLVKEKNGKTINRTVNDMHGEMIADSGGQWAIINKEKNIGIINYFKPLEAEIYLCKTGDDYLNMELFGKEKTVKPGQSLKIDHSYQVLDNLKGLNTIFDMKGSQSVKKKLIKPMYSRELTYGPGLIGDAGIFNGKTRLQFPLRYIKANAGTIEMLIKPKKNPASRLGFLISIGNGQPLRFMVGLNKDQVGFLYSEKEGNRHKYYNNLICRKELPDDQWTFLCFIWGKGKKGECLMQTYINGKPAENRFNQAFNNRWPEKERMFGIGFNTAGFKSPGYHGKIDELRISNYPKSPKEIKKAYETLTSGKPLSEEPGTLFLMHFDKNDTAESATAEDSKPAEVNKKIKEIIDELH